MFEILGTLLAGVLSGGATGLLGVLIQRYFDHKSKAQDLDQLRMQLDNARELARIEGERSTRVAELDMEARFAEADAGVMQASFAHDAASYLAPDTRLTKLAFRNRFTQAEKVMLEIASLDNPAATMPQRQQAAALRATLADIASASYIDLTRPDTRDGVLALESAGLLATGRAAAVLDSPVVDSERYKAA